MPQPAEGPSPAAGGYPAPIAIVAAHPAVKPGHATRAGAVFLPAASAHFSPAARGSVALHVVSSPQPAAPLFNAAGPAFWGRPCAR